MSSNDPGFKVYDICRTFVASPEKRQAEVTKATSIVCEYRKTHSTNEVIDLLNYHMEHSTGSSREANKVRFETTCLDHLIHNDNEEFIVWLWNEGYLPKMKLKAFHDGLLSDGHWKKMFPQKYQWFQTLTEKLKNTVPTPQEKS